MSTSRRHQTKTPREICRHALPYGPAVAVLVWSPHVIERSETGAVRKQYHFWRGETGLDAWDVDRLIRLSRDLPVIDVDVSAIGEVDTVYWFDETETPTVRRVVDHLRLINEVDVAHPIIVGPDGRVMDGMHRVARAMLEGRPTIRAVRFEQLPEPDYRNCRPSELPYD